MNIGATNSDIMRPEDAVAPGEEFKRDGWDGIAVKQLVDAISGVASEAQSGGKRLLLWMAL